MNTTELSELLRDATAELEPPQDFTRHVLAGGRRRRLRRRLAVAASAVVVAAVAAAGTVVALNPAPQTDTAAELLSRPTQGPLANDRKFLGQVLDVWESELTYAQQARFRVYDDLRGAPHILWAGDTPYGRAAVVVQQTYLHRDYWQHTEGMRMAKGLVAVDPADGKLKLVATLSPTAEPGAVSYFYLGPPAYRTMLIVDEGKPLYYSATTIGTGGEVDMGEPYRPEWRRVQASDGVALVSITDRPGPGQSQRLLAYQGDHPPEVVDINTESVRNYQAAGADVDNRLADPNYRLPIPNFFPWKDKWTLGTPVPGMSTDTLSFNARPRGAWQITVWLPDRVVFMQETMVIRQDSRRDSKGSVLTVAIGGIVGNELRYDFRDAVDGAVVDHRAVLPVKYHIPDGGGWVVANKGKTLSYRVQGGQWQSAGRDAALLPDNAVEVKVGDQVVKL